MTELPTCSNCMFFIPDDAFYIYGQCTITERYYGKKNVCEKWKGVME